MTHEPAATAAPPLGLRDLDRVPLTPANRARLDQAMADCDGLAHWRLRKRAEARDVLALEQICPRLRVWQLDLRQAIRLVVSLEGPVPCMAEPGGELQVAPRSLLGVTYPAEATLTPLPGMSFVQILAPPRVWHASVHYGPAAPLCLGITLPANTPVKEIVFLSYGALSMQTVNLDEQSPEGVLNRAAARYYLEHPEHIPLTSTPFLVGRGTPNAYKKGLSP